MLSSFGLAFSNLLRGLSQLRLLFFSILRRPSLQSSWLFPRPGTVEQFAVPLVVSVLLFLKRFLDGLNLVFQVGRFQFLCVFPRHFLCIGTTSHRCDSLRLCLDVVFTFVASVAVDSSSIKDVNLCSSRSSQSRTFY